MCPNVYKIFLLMWNVFFVLFFAEVAGLKNGFSHLLTRLCEWFVSLWIYRIKTAS